MTAVRASRLFLGWIALAALVAALALWVVPTLWPRTVAAATPRPVTPRPALPPHELAVVELFERTRASVVYITTQAQVVDVWTRNQFNIPRGTGSGFIWDEAGHIVTNHHVVAGASSATVRLSDGRDERASLVGVSAEHDLAVLKIGVTNLPTPLAVGTSADLRVGQTTFAIGNPFGLDWTLTTGIVSSLDRALPTEDGRRLIDHLIQTDAAINPGNSGGPLLDSAGRLIGVNTMIYSPSGASVGVGFAVPVDTVNRVVPELVAKGTYVRPALGIELDERLNQLLSQRTGTAGVAVLRVVPGSAAERAGLRGVRQAADGGIVAGDIIVAVDGSPVDSVARLLNRLDDRKVGDRVRVTIVRDGQKTDVEVTLQAGAR